MILRYWQSKKRSKRSLIGEIIITARCTQFETSDCVHPCPCGYYGDPVKECTCSNAMITRYQKRISGPMMDRIDIHIEVPRVEYEKLSDDRLGEPSFQVQKRVESARKRQINRFSDEGIISNAEMGAGELRKYCHLDDTCRALMRTAMRQMQLSARAYHRVLKLARTISDLVGDEEIAPAHLAEALQYRPKTQVF